MAAFYLVIQAFTYAGTPYHFTLAGNPTTYNTTYADAVSQLGNLQVLGMNLIVDSGFAGDEVVSLTSATVGVGNGAATPYTETFTPQPVSALTPTCPTLQATIRMTKVDGVPIGAVNEPLTIQPQGQQRHLPDR